MVGTQERSEDNFGIAQWVALGTCLAGLAYLFVTQNLKIWSVFNLAAGLLISLDYYLRKATSPLQMPSLTAPPGVPRRKVQYHPLMWTGFGLMLISVIFVSRPHVFAVLAFSSLCVLLLNRYRSSRS